MNVTFYLQAENEKGSVNSILRESQESLQKARDDLSAQHAKLTRLLGHVAALTVLHKNCTPPALVRLAVPSSGDA